MHLLQPPIMLFSHCGPNDRGRGKMMSVTRCFCTSTNKPPSESLIVAGHALGKLQAAEGLIRSRNSLLRKVSGKNNLYAPLKPQSIQAKPKKPVQRRGPGGKSNFLPQGGRGKQRQGCYKTGVKEMLRMVQPSGRYIGVASLTSSRKLSLYCPTPC